MELRRRRKLERNAGELAARFLERDFALALRRIVRVPGIDSVALRMEPSGKVRAYTSVTAMGQGIQTALAQLIADELGIDITDVTVETGDSTLAPYGSGAFASRGAVVGGGAAVLAARRVRDKIVAIAAAGLEAPPEDLVVGAGRVSVKGSPFRSITIIEVAHRAYMASPDALPPAMSPTSRRPRTASRRFRSSRTASTSRPSRSTPRPAASIRAR